MNDYILNPVEHLEKLRDLTLIRINNDQYIVVACDSGGGIGEKPKDVVQISAEEIAEFVTRVPLFELISCSAKPFLVIDCLSVEMEPTGKRMIRAIKDYVKEVGIERTIQVTGTTEDNVPTLQTGIGVTILGIVDKEKLTVGFSEVGDKVVSVGIPKSGPDDQISNDDEEILTLSDLIKLRNYKYSKDILPVGSKGILYEAKELAKSAGLKFSLENNPVKMDIHKSAGPSTCVLLSIKEQYIDELKAIVKAPVSVIGALESG